MYVFSKNELKASALEIEHYLVDSGLVVTPSKAHVQESDSEVSVSAPAMVLLSEIALETSNTFSEISRKYYFDTDVLTEALGQLVDSKLLNPRFPEEHKRVRPDQFELTEAGMLTLREMRIEPEQMSALSKASLARSLAKEFDFEEQALSAEHESPMPVALSTEKRVRPNERELNLILGQIVSRSPGYQRSLDLSGSGLRASPLAAMVLLRTREGSKSTPEDLASELGIRLNEVQQAISDLLEAQVIKTKADAKTVQSFSDMDMTIASHEILDNRAINPGLAVLPMWGAPGPVLLSEDSFSILEQLCEHENCIKTDFVKRFPKSRIDTVRKIEALEDLGFVTTQGGLLYLHEFGKEALEHHRLFSFNSLPLSYIEDLRRGSVKTSRPGELWEGLDRTQGAKSNTQPVPDNQTPPATEKTHSFERESVALPTPNALASSAETQDRVTRDSQNLSQYMLDQVQRNMNRRFTVGELGLRRSPNQGAAIAAQQEIRALAIQSLFATGFLRHKVDFEGALKKGCDQSSFTPELEFSPLGSFTCQAIDLRETIELYAQYRKRAYLGAIAATPGRIDEICESFQFNEADFKRFIDSQEHEGLIAINTSRNPEDGSYHPTVHSLTNSIQSRTVYKSQMLDYISSEGEITRTTLEDIIQVREGRPTNMDGVIARLVEGGGIVETHEKEGVRYRLNQEKSEKELLGQFREAIKSLEIDPLTRGKRALRHDLDPEKRGMLKFLYENRYIKSAKLMGTSGAEQIGVAPFTEDDLKKLTRIGAIERFSTRRKTLDYVFLPKAMTDRPYEEFEEFALARMAGAVETREVKSGELSLLDFKERVESLKIELQGTDLHSYQNAVLAARRRGSVEFEETASVSKKKSPANLPRVA